MNPSKRTRTSLKFPTPDETTEETVDPQDDIDTTTQNPGRDADYGTSTSIKIFYEGKRSHPGGYNWVEKPPKQLDVKIVKAFNAVAIKVFKIKDHEQPTIGGRTPLKIHSFEIQSPILIAALKDIVKDEGCHLEGSENAQFNAPFKVLYFCFEKIEKLWEREKKGLLKEHLGLLMGVLREIFDPMFRHLKNLSKSGLISYQYAWTYFPRNTMVFAATKDCERVGKAIRASYVGGRDPHLAVQCEIVAFDGEKGGFEWEDFTMEIPQFAGNKPVTDLDYYPMSFHPEKEEVLERLEERAKKAIEYQELTYCEYTGVALQVVSKCQAMRHNVSFTFFIVWKRNAVVVC